MRSEHEACVRPSACCARTCHWPKSSARLMSVGQRHELRPLQLAGLVSHVATGLARAGRGYKILPTPTHSIPGERLSLALSLPSFIKLWRNRKSLHFGLQDRGCLPRSGWVLCPQEVSDGSVRLCLALRSAGKRHRMPACLQIPCYAIGPRAGSPPDLTGAHVATWQSAERRPG